MSDGQKDLLLKGRRVDGSREFRNCVNYTRFKKWSRISNFKLLFYYGFRVLKMLSRKILSPETILLAQNPSQNLINTVFLLPRCIYPKNNTTCTTTDTLLGRLKSPKQRQKYSFKQIFNSRTAQEISKFLSAISKSLSTGKSAKNFSKNAANKTA